MRVYNGKEREITFSFIVTHEETDQSDDNYSLSLNLGTTQKMKGRKRRNTTNKCIQDLTSMGDYRLIKVFFGECQVDRFIVI